MSCTPKKKWFSCTKRCSLLACEQPQLTTDIYDHLHTILLVSIHVYVTINLYIYTIYTLYIHYRCIIYTLYTSQSFSILSDASTPNQCPHNCLHRRLDGLREARKPVSESGASALSTAGKLRSKAWNSFHSMNLKYIEIH